MRHLCKVLCPNDFHRYKFYNEIIPEDEMDNVENVGKICAQLYRDTLPDSRGRPQYELYTVLYGIYWALGASRYSRTWCGSYEKVTPISDLLVTY